MAGGTLLLAGAAIQITRWEYAPMLFAVGAVIFVTGQLADRYNGDDLIMKRLRGQQVLGSVFIILTALLMFSGDLHENLLLNSGTNHKLRSFLLDLTRRNNWIVTLTIAALLELYPAFRMESRQKELDRSKGES
ncbi:MAG: hypothetical protein IKS24_05975 [Bacteroidaceae bacterium]|nr:hypothetical protein [Bacteroidaceae bacterium]